MIELFLALHPVVQAIAVVVSVPLLLISALLVTALVVELINACYENHCRVKIAVAAAKREDV